MDTKLTLIFAALAAIALISCDRRLDVQEQPQTDGSSSVFTASTESPATKTALEQDGEQYNVNWQDGDRITIVDAASNVGVYTTTSTTTQGSFTYVPESGDEAVTAPYKAWYPAGIYNGGTPALPATQNYVAGNISGSPMYAESGTTDLAFKNIAGIIRLNISTLLGGKKVRRIELSANEGMSGTITNAAALATSEYAATVSGTAGVTLDCGVSGVAISNVATPFHIAVPANTYTGLKITVVTTDGEVQTRTAKSGIEVTRSSITTIALSFGSLIATTGIAPVAGGGTQEWVQLWAGGPKWAKFNIGTSITSYADVTEYTTATTGGYYSYRGRYDSVADAAGTDDTAAYVWGSNWATPTGAQQEALLANCDWIYCDGSTVQYEPGCTLAGWKVVGKEAGYTENSIFLPLSGIRDQNNRERETVGTRGCYWSSNSGGSGAYFINLNPAVHDYVSANQPHGLSVRAVCVFDDRYADLSATETANTYIVTSAGGYRFKATVKGNGGFDPLTGTTATTIDPADISGVTVLWEQGQNPGYAIQQTAGVYDISYAAGYVTFIKPATDIRNTACVAIYKDGEGGTPGAYDQSYDEILWSWLIWSSPEPGTITHNGKTFMDRNLGASLYGLGENYARGFLFQWGRKDAFSAASGSNTDVYWFSPVAADVFTEYPTEVKSMAYTVAHPTARIVCWTDATHSWMPESEYSKRPWREDVKTIYDPCPPGWKVPSKADMDGITGLPDTGLYDSSNAANNLRHFGNSDLGYYWTSTISDDPEYPANAYAFCNDGRNINNWSQAEGYAIRPVRE